MQVAKILDVTRSYVPVDPSAYPQNLHATGDEDEPEKRIPIIPYMGHNFLPTSYGYKSFFGANAALGIDSLAPNKPDYVFIFQSLAYKNIIVALCDTGIWLKAADNAGAWTQAVVMAAPADDVFYEWYFETIKNKLYLFRANDDHFYEMATNIAQPLGVEVIEKTPTFITMTAQLGMFRLGSRLGFWDAENAIAYSSPDDLTNFTPAILSGANVTTFNAVTGKISNIRSHGTNAVIYASKSIVGLMIQPGETFLVKAIPILQESGVPYARNSVKATPDTVHYVYASTGIYKIEDGKPEVIVPEVFDFFKTYTTSPIYLRLLQGRFLAFEVLDENLLTGTPAFSTGFIPGSSLTFPGHSSLEDSHDADIEDVNICEVVSQISAGLTDEQQTAASSAIGEPQMPGSKAEPIYQCYVSNNGVKDIDNVTFDNTPCGFVGPNGTAFTMSPSVGGTNKPEGLTQDNTGKTVVPGASAYVDGKWTMERFIQYQTAIWKMEEKILADLINKIVNRAFSEEKSTPYAIGCAVAALSTAECDLGYYNSKFSKPKFGYNACSFWLTRFLIESKEITARNATETRCDTTVANQALAGWKLVQNGNTLPTIYPTPDAACAAWNYFAGSYHAKASADTASIAIQGASGNYFTQILYVVADGANVAQTTPGGPNGCFPVWTAVLPAGATDSATPGNITGGVVTPPVLKFTSTTKVETANAHNVVTDTQSGILGIETAYCEIIGWKYTDVNGNVKTTSSLSCSDTSDKYPGAAPSGGGDRTVPFEEERDTAPDDTSGNFCGINYEPPLFDPVDWPAQTINYPESSFLLQDGGIAPKYPTIYGFYCYDLHLKKWGKAKLEYKQLLDYSPINSESSSAVSFANFGILAGAVKEDGYIYIFDDSPTDSRITWGKYGYYRKGMSDLQEIRFHFAKPATGQLLVDTSIDGIQTVDTLQYSVDFTNSKEVISFPPYAGKWFNITITGKYDISYAEVVGLRKGRR